MSSLSTEWAVSMAFSIVLLLVFGLGLVWLNIERVDMAYEINRTQRKIEEAEALVAKLDVERNTLITPARLREMARQSNLGPARPGQIRRVNAAGQVEAAVGAEAAPSQAEAKLAATPVKTVRSKHKR